MPKYLRRVWKTKGTYIKGLIVVLIFVALTAQSITPAGLGIVAGLLIAVVLYLGPIVLVDAKGLKIKDLKPKFVEARTLKITFWYFIAMAIVTAVVVAVLMFSGAGSYIAREADADTFMAGLLIMFIILTILLVPVTAYMLYIKIAYKRVVEYGTAEWRRLRT